MRDFESLLCFCNIRTSTSIAKTISKLIIYVIIFISCSYVFNSFYLLSSSIQPLMKSLRSSTTISLQNPTEKSPDDVGKVWIYPIKSQEKTQLHHIVFGIASTSKLWEHRKDYIKIWWKPNEMRGFVWLDEPVRQSEEDNQTLPPVKISSDTLGFEYKNSMGDQSAIRMTRVVSETVRLGLNDVRWIVLGDDDTIFFADNLVRILSKYDHNHFYYIGKSSETHVQNILFSYNMGYGGAGFAISYPLAKTLEQMQDKCINKYPKLYGSDDRIQACMAELGVPLTVEKGFHQMDIRGNPFGVLAAHPIAPLVSLHHLDVIEPIFPNAGRIQSLQRLKMPMKLDEAGLMQQSICYDGARNWTISVSWGYAAQIFMGIIPAREMEIPLRTFSNWYRMDNVGGFSFNTRSLSISPCKRPFVYVLSFAVYNRSANRTVSEYVQARSWTRSWTRSWNSKCNQTETGDPSRIWRIEVYKMRDPDLWDKPPRRNCCRLLPIAKEGTIVVDIGECKEGEIIEL